MKIAAIVFFVLVVLMGAHAVWYYHAIGWDAVDDAYISYVYARNAVLGHGLTFNPSERVEGYSNFLWTAMMVPIVGSGLDVGRVSSALGVAFGVGVLALAVRFPRWLGISPIVGWMAALFLGADGSFALWSVSGLETPMFAFLVALGAFLYLKENFQAAVSGKQQGLAIPASGIVFAMAAMTRPEAAAVLALTVAHQGAWRILDERKLWTRADLIRTASFVSLFVPYWLIRWRYYHSLLPNSFYAKVSLGGPVAQITRGWEHVQQFVGVHLGWVILAPAVLALVLVIVRYLRRGNGTAKQPGTGSDAHKEGEARDSRIEDVRRACFGLTYFAALVIFYGGYIVYVGGDWSVGRFFVPMLAFVYFMIAAGIYWFIEFVWRRFALRKILNVAEAGWLDAGRIALALGVLLALVLWWASSYDGEYEIYIGGFDAARATEARIAAGKWLKQNVAPGTWIAVDAAGQVPYFSELPALDMFGINDLHIGRMPVANLGSGTPGHEKFDLGYIIARAPQYVVIYGTLFDSVTEYKRANVNWTDNPELLKFLTVYVRK